MKCNDHWIRRLLFPEGREFGEMLPKQCGKVFLLSAVFFLDRAFYPIYYSHAKNCIMEPLVCPYWAANNGKAHGNVLEVIDVIPAGAVFREVLLHYQPSRIACFWWVAAITCLALRPCVVAGLETG